MTAHSKEWSAHLRHTSWAKYLLLSAAVATLLAAVVYCALVYDRWEHSRIDLSQDIASGNAARCDAIKLACKEEARSRTDTESNPYLELAVEQSCTQRLERQALLRSEYARIEISECPRAEVAPFMQALSTSYWHSALYGALFGAVAVWLILIATVVLVRLFVAEPNLGWRRLALLAGVIGTAAGAIYAIDEVDVIPIVLAATAAAFAAVLVGRRVYLWVSDGFNASVPATTEYSSRAADTVSTASDASFPIKKILGGIAIAIFLIVAFVINPEAAIATYIATLVQVLVIVFVFYAGKAIVVAIRNRRSRRRVPTRVKN